MGNSQSKIYQESIDNLAALIATKKQEQIDEIREGKKDKESPEKELASVEDNYLKVVEGKKKDKEFDREQEDSFKEYEAKLKAYRQTVADKMLDFLKAKYPHEAE